MMTVQIHKVTGSSKKGDTKQVTVLVGQGSSRRSVTRHVKRGSGGWVGQNPDPETSKRRESAARVVSRARADAQALQEHLKGLREMIQRDLRPEEMEKFRAQGLTSEVGIKNLVNNLIPFVEQNLKESQKVVENAIKFEAEIQEAYPLTVQFVGGGL